MKHRNGILLWAGWLTVTCIMTGLDLMCGGECDAAIMRMLRIPRAFTAALAGAALALSGAQMQSIFRNPLADPHIMGVSSGASLGAAAAIMLSGRFMMEGTAVAQTLGGLSIAGAASAGAAISSAAILAVSGRLRHSGTLLIFGVMLGFIVSATVSILQFTTDAESLKIFYGWAAGTFSSTSWPQISVMAAALIAGTAIAYTNSKGLDIILFGDEFAEMAGASPKGIRINALLSCCLMTGAVTAFCGPLGFIGIISPHIVKFLSGSSSHRKMIPSCLMCGASISLASDMLARIFPTPLPVASTMAIVGIPVILYILIRRPLI